jgi:hypothetical protein
MISAENLMGYDRFKSSRRNTRCFAKWRSKRKKRPFRVACADIATIGALRLQVADGRSDCSKKMLDNSSYIRHIVFKLKRRDFGGRRVHTRLHRSPQRPARCVGRAALVLGIGV